MAESPVINASPLIFLSRANLLDLLRLVGETIVVPAEVVAEISRRGSDDPTARALRDRKVTKNRSAIRFVPADSLLFPVPSSIRAIRFSCGPELAPKGWNG